MAPQLPKLNGHGTVAKKAFFGTREAKNVSIDPIIKPRIKVFARHLKIARADVFC